MMPGYGYGMAGWGWVFMSVGSLMFLALVGIVVWLLVRATATGSGSRPAGLAREILAERFARGEIDDTEYQQRLRTLGG